MLAAPVISPNNKMPDFFDFLYDDEAKNPLEKLIDLFTETPDSVKKTADEAINGTTGKWTIGAAKVGLVAGVAVGAFILVVGTTNGLVEKLTGKK